MHIFLLNSSVVRHLHEVWEVLGSNLLSFFLYTYNTSFYMQKLKLKPMTISRGKHKKLGTQNRVFYLRLKLGIDISRAFVNTV